ncbi:hypothetical protein K1719_047509, partial [Acacia pycnantha]
MARSVKFELSTSKGGFETPATPASASQSNEERRDLRSRYQLVKNLIHDESKDITRPDSDNFNLIFRDVESLHQRVLWKDVGVAVSGVFKGGAGCCTMIGPMDTEINQRKTVNRRANEIHSNCSAKRGKTYRMEFLQGRNWWAELDGRSREKIVDTDENMSSMFNILRENRVVRLENLVLNRNSFAQTVENLFALSFLVKDGRAEIKVNENGWQLVSPRNAPSANTVLSGEVAHSHFVFRFDFKDWK